MSTAVQPDTGLTWRLLRMASPLFVAQVAVMMNGIIDTLMAGRLSAHDVAGIGLGSSIYFSVYIGLMGILQAMVPVCARHHGAGQPEAISNEVRQGFWLALLLSIPGGLALSLTGFWLDIAQPPEQVAAVTRPYLLAAAAGLPAALLFRLFHALAISTSRPGLVMSLNLAMLAFKVPANLLFMYGLQLGDTVLIPAMGGAGCGVATATIAWLTVLASVMLLAWQADLREYRILRAVRPCGAWMLRTLRLGLPIGATQLVEVTAFTFMAIFLARQDAAVGASHQIAARLAGLSYMIGLAIGIATSTMSAQSLGAGQSRQARHVALTGLRLGGLAGLIAMVTLYLLRDPLSQLFSHDASVIAMAAPLVGLVCFFHFFDSAQTQLTLVLRAWHITASPMLVHLTALWGIGLGGGWWLTYGRPAQALSGDASPGAAGFWLAGTISLAVATAALAVLLARTWRRDTQAEGAAADAAPMNRSR